MALTDKLTAIADAIRAKDGTTGTMTLDQMPEKITAITTADNIVHGDIPDYIKSAALEVAKKGQSSTDRRKYNIYRYV